MLQRAAKTATQVCLLMFQSLLFKGQLNTLNSGPRLLGLEAWDVVLCQQKAVHAEVNATVLLKQPGEVV